MGFMASTGQLEFLLYAVENAPVLEVLTLDPACRRNVDHQGRTYFTEMVCKLAESTMMKEYYQLKAFCSLNLSGLIL
jgi:hypothetical protein